MKKITQITLIVIAILFLVIFDTIGLSRYFGKPEKETGIVLHKSEQLKYSKHSSSHHMYLVVDFGKEIRDVYVNTHTYLTTEIGNNVTFNKDIFRKDIAGFFCFMSLALTGLILVFVFIGSLVFLYS